jgi:catechol 2,3-dioxygenase-like lactoylglutathione lyase family enzyme
MSSRHASSLPSSTPYLAPKRSGKDAARPLTNGDTAPRLVGLTKKGLRRTMKIADADHTNWRVRDVERSLGFYRDVLGLEPFGLEEYERGEHPLVSLRVTPTFILHLRPDPTFEAISTGGYDHLALVVEGTSLDALAERLTDAGVEIERTSENVVGARGSGEALYVRDPDGYLIELKLYTDRQAANLWKNSSPIKLAHRVFQLVSTSAC